MDIDIDLAPNVDIEKIFRNAVPASMVENGALKKHPVGYYFQNIPIDNITGMAAIPYDSSEDYGYFKIDMLTVNILEKFDSKEEMRKLQREEPDWDMLEDESVVKQLFHLGKHFDTINKIKPRSIQELADVFALIRPNKRRLIDKYINNPDEVREELFTKREASDMRRAHAIPYAILIVLQLHLMKQGRYENTNKYSKGTKVKP